MFGIEEHSSSIIKIICCSDELYEKMRESNEQQA